MPGRTDLSYARADPADPSLAALLEAHAAHGDAHYPAESNHHQDGVALAADGAVLFVARDALGPVGMGGWKRLDARQGEIKSMHVLDRVRGRGVGAALLALIEADARDAGMERLSLETGSREASAAARRLYERAGFAPCAPFGAYRADPESVFMTRSL